MLAVSGLEKSFVAPDGVRATVVSVKEFSLAAGSQLALRGESGTGKTTFLHLIAGILAADAGRIELDGVAMTALSEPQRDRLRAGKLGYIFQAFNLLQGHTALENVVLGMSFGPHGADRAHARELLERRGVDAWGTGWTISPHSSSRPASSSAWPWRAPWPTGRSSCWRTNPPAASTARAPKNRSRSSARSAVKTGAALLLVRSHDFATGAGAV